MKHDYSYIFTNILHSICIILYFLQFLEVGPELGNTYNEVIASQDVATYGGLCALASFDRTELKVVLSSALSFIISCEAVTCNHNCCFIRQNKVIDNINFRNFLELVPEVRELIHDFYSR